MSKPNLTLEAKRELIAEEYYKTSGWVPTENAVMNFKAGWNAAVAHLAELSSSEFDEHGCWYHQGYDSEKEPAVKYIINGARYQHNLMWAAQVKLQEELQQTKGLFSVQLDMHDQIVAKDAKIAELETYLATYKNNNDLFEEAIRLPFKKREDELHYQIDILKTEAKLAVINQQNLLIENNQLRNLLSEMRETLNKIQNMYKFAGDPKKLITEQYENYVFNQVQMITTEALTKLESELAKLNGGEK